MLLLSTLILVAPPSYRCFDSTHAPCTQAALADPSKRQLLFLATGFTASEREVFFAEVHVMIDQLVGPAVQNVWSRRHASDLLFIAQFTASSDVGNANARFGAKVVAQPSRGKALSLALDSVYAEVARLKAQELATLRPIGVLVLFDFFFPSDDDVIGNAAPPSFTQKGYGVAKMSRQELINKPRRLSHELAHASMNLLDEYVEHGLEDVNIRQLDVLTPLLLLDASWSGALRAVSDLSSLYDWDFSDLLANNGADNVALSRWPATVSTRGFTPERYDYEHGMFFGRGVFHMRGKNLMNSDRIARGPDDGFALDHSASQLRSIATAFDGMPRRPNDRLRAAGPKNGWPLAFGDATRVMLADPDKLHAFQPTTRYDVQLGWYERDWKTCWAGFVPYPCYEEVWTTAERQVTPKTQTVKLESSAAFGLAGLVQKILCGAGVDEIKSNEGVFHLCEADLSVTLGTLMPTLVFAAPYQEVTVPARQWMTTYYWRFRTHNAATASGWTGWSSFYRSL